MNTNDTDVFNLGLACELVGLPVVSPATAAAQHDAERSAWSDQVTKDLDLTDLLIFAKQALPSAEVPCGCGPEYECLRCRVERAVQRYLPGRP